MSSSPAAAFFLFLALTLSSPSSSHGANSTAPLSWKLSEVKSLASFRDALRDPLGALAGWDPSTPSAPCDWPGVVCFENRVTQLSLPRLQLAGLLVGSLFRGLPQLRKLNLHSNAIAGSIPSAISQCTLLRGVYLHSNFLTGSLPQEIFNLTNLRVLNLSRNLLSGRIPGGRFSAGLRVLDLSGNAFSGELPTNLSEYSDLEALDLSFNQFRGQIPAGLGRLQELKFLSLDSNMLYGTLPSTIANCSKLVYLSAEDNDIEGLLPWTFGSMPSLEVLSLSSNNLSGPIDSSLFCDYNVSRSSSLRVVKLAGNGFNSLSESSGVKCSGDIEVIDLHDNGITGRLPFWLATVSTLRTINLSRNLFRGELPAGIGNLSRLQQLNFSHNSLSGKIPATIEKCRSLEVLDLGVNQFSGQIPKVLSKLGRLKVVSLRENIFTGPILLGLGNLLGLQTLDLSSNNLTGNVPGDILLLQNLSSLSLSSNQLSGGVPYRVEDLKSLVVLNLSNCGLSGNIPVSIGSLMRLSTLDLSMQNLSGELPLEIFGLPSLQIVALQGNLLSGDIPEGFSSLASLQYLNLSSNAFSGQIPRSYAFLESLMVLSISANKLHGPIPVELGNISSLEVLELGSNSLEGVIPASFSRLSRLKRLDLGQNIFSGEIPEDLHKCSSLAILLLDGNRLSGPIPASLSRLGELTFLDLSSNNLTGRIPANLSDLPALVYLNLSHNNLEGEIPPALGSRFNDPSVYQSNRKLCGQPLSQECPGVTSRKRKRLILLICLIVAGSFLLVLCCCCYVYGLILWRKKLREAAGEKKRSPRTSSGADRGRGSGENGEPKLVMFESKVTYAEALEATRHFAEENVLSRGRYGVVYKAAFLDGMVLAIRKLTNGSIDDRTFSKEAEALGKVRHRNLTVLRGYYAGPHNVRLLVYDYMPNGNLATLIQEASHRDGHVLNWPMRHLIALGIARGLAYLHALPMVHGDLKPQNVLFDADFESHLSEFGLERLVSMTMAEASSSATQVGIGYVAPEATSTGESTKESDVYSFGIMLLEILTGKRPVAFTPDEDIVKWVKKQLQKGQISELIEPGLLELDPESSEWEEFLLGVKVALLCTAPDPHERPSTADVVFMLEGCRVGPDIPSSADQTSLPSPV